MEFRFSLQKGLLGTFTLQYLLTYLGGKNMHKEEEVRSDLLTLDDNGFFMKYIVKSPNWYFHEYLKQGQNRSWENLDRFKEIVSKHFSISFHCVQIVGSAKLGLSLSPEHLLSPFRAEFDGNPSDLDVALISEKLFLKWWRILREKCMVLDMMKGGDVNYTAKAVFRGFIGSQSLLNQSELRKIWDDDTRGINKEIQDKVGIVHPVTYRIYRSWEDLEEYQIYSIKKARKELTQRDC